MSLAADYRPCPACGAPCDGDCCDRRCADVLDERARFTRGEIDDEGNELGDYCLWCGDWYAYEITPGPYCDGICALKAERD